MESIQLFSYLLYKVSLEARLESPFYIFSGFGIHCWRHCWWGFWNHR